MTYSTKRATIYETWSGIRASESGVEIWLHESALYEITFCIILASTSGYEVLRGSILSKRFNPLKAFYATKQFSRIVKIEKISPDSIYAKNTRTLFNGIQLRGPLLHVYVWKSNANNVKSKLKKKKKNVLVKNTK